MQSRIQCGMCSSATSQYCTTCKSITYCSKTCEKSDRSAHKLICAAPVPPPPVSYGAGSTYATVLFPVKEEAPRFVRFSGRSRQNRYFGDYNDDTCDGSYSRYHPAVQILHVQEPACTLLISGNVLRSRPGVNHRIELFYDDKIPADGSGLNRSILNATNGRLEQSWYGPLLAVKVLLTGSRPEYGDMTMVDYRDVIDLLSTFPTVNISDMTSVPAAASPKTDVPAVRVNCPGDQALGRPKFEVITIRTDNPACLAPVTSISRLIEFPLRIVRCSPPFAATYSEPTHDISNPAAMYLNMGVDPEKGWGFVGLDWLDPAGSATVVREGGEVLNPQHLEALCHWCLFVLKPLFEDSKGRGRNPGAPLGKEEVLARVTRRDFENFYVGFDEWKGSVDPAWKKGVWPFC